jgi:hypothetical protein
MLDAAIADIQLQQLDLQDSRIEAELLEAEDGRKMELLQEKAQLGVQRGSLAERARVGWRVSRRQRQRVTSTQRPPPQHNE